MPYVQELADEITAEGGTAKAYECNVLDKAAVMACHEQVLADFGPCDILLNGAGGNHPRRCRWTRRCCRRGLSSWCGRTFHARSQPFRMYVHQSSLSGPEAGLQEDVKKCSHRNS